MIVPDTSIGLALPSIRRTTETTRDAGIVTPPLAARASDSVPRVVDDGGAVLGVEQLAAVTPLGGSRRCRCGHGRSTSCSTCMTCRSWKLPEHEASHLVAFAGTCDARRTTASTKAACSHDTLPHCGVSLPVFAGTPQAKKLIGKTRELKTRTSAVPPCARNQTSSNPGYGGSISRR